MEQFVTSRNDIPVFYNTNSALHSIELGLYIRCGAMYEDAEENGVKAVLYGIDKY